MLSACRSSRAAVGLCWTIVNANRYVARGDWRAAALLRHPHDDRIDAGTVAQRNVESEAAIIGDREVATTAAGVLLFDEVEGPVSARLDIAAQAWQIVTPLVRQPVIFQLVRQMRRHTLGNRLMVH